MIRPQTHIIVSRSRNDRIQIEKNHLQNTFQYTKGFSACVYLTWGNCLGNLLQIHLYLGQVLGLWVFCSLCFILASSVLHPQPYTHRHTASQNFLFHRLIFSSHWLSRSFGSYPSDRCKFGMVLSRRETSSYTFHLLVLFFQSLLNSKWGDCCPSDRHGDICITELAVSSSK